MRQTRFGDVVVTHSARGIPTAVVEAFHDGLHKHVVLRATEAEILQHKAVALAQRWDAEWERQSAREFRIRRTFEKKEARRLHIEVKEIAAERATEAQQLLETLQTILTAILEADPALDWDLLKVNAVLSRSSHKADTSAWTGREACPAEA